MTLSPLQCCSHPTVHVQKYVPLDLRPKKTRAIRKRMTKHQVSILVFLKVCTLKSGHYALLEVKFCRVKASNCLHSLWTLSQDFSFTTYPLYPLPPSLFSCIPWKCLNCVAVGPKQSTAVDLLLSKDAHVLRMLLRCAANQQAREAEEEGKCFPSAKVCCQGLNAHCKYHLQFLSQAATYVADMSNSPC